MLDTSPLLSDFYKTHAPTDLTQQCAAIRGACEIGGGNWTTPQDHAPSRSPATHLHEIRLYGVTAMGATARAAVRNWFKVAAALLSAGVAA